MPPPIVDSYWKPGDQVLIRFRRTGLVSYAIPATIVRDDPECSMLFVTPGTPTKTRVMPDGSPIPRDLPYDQLAGLPHKVGDGMWQRNHGLIIFPHGVAHDVRLYWSEGDWSFRGWYVSLQDPVRRVATGFDTGDHVLDLDVDPDLQWHWKDEDEFAIAHEIGRFTPAEAAAIRAEGERVIAEVEARRWPFDGSLLDWRPDPSWPVPSVPDNWNEDA
ncbi:MAG: DUF402 domain-containing protein [Thermomicrobiales bacterium]